MNSVAFKLPQQPANDFLPQICPHGAVVGAHVSWASCPSESIRMFYTDAGFSLASFRRRGDHGRCTGSVDNAGSGSHRAAAVHDSREQSHCELYFCANALAGSSSLSWKT